MKLPISSADTITLAATGMEARAPQSVRMATSRPRASVPSGWESEGESNRSSTSSTGS